MTGGAVFALAFLTNAYAQNKLTLNNKAYADGQHLVSVYVDGSKRVVATSASTVGSALSNINVEVGKGDVVEPAPETAINQPIFNVNIYRALPATIFDDGKKVQVLTGYQSPRQIITAAGLTSYPEDVVTMDRVDDFSLGGTVGRQISIKRAKPVQVVLAGQVYNFRTQKNTVGELFAERGMQVSPGDIMSSTLDSPLSAGERIVVNRLSQTVAQSRESIEAGLSYEYDPSQPVGYTSIKQEGKPGVKIVSYLISLKDGSETGRSVLEEKVLEPAVVRIVVKGSKRVEAAAGQVPDLIIKWADYYGVDQTRLLRVAYCESKYNPRASNGTHFGVYQFLPSTYAANAPKAGAGSDYWDAENNVRTAAYMFSIGQAGQWACK